VEALEGFFQGLPPQPGLGFIVVTHLSPDRESLLHEIIARHTDLSVVVAEDDVAVRPNCVYVLPADAIISLVGGRLQLRKSSNGRRERKPIDILFSSLAIDQGEYAASVVLSGGDGDGTLGTKAIKERGGLTLAQVADGHGPRHSSMPDSAISTGYVDFAIPAHEMGARLAEFARDLAEGSGEPDPANGGASAQAEISAIIRNQIGHDFGGYKSNTFFRRVQRRMQVLQVSDQAKYIERLKGDPKEVGTLFRDLLINVTNFFRDGDAFDTLRDLVVPKLFEGRGADDSVRIWVPGCATGEEVYSIAILLRERMDQLTAVPRVQVFATDIDEAALGVARAGRYPEALLDTVSPERRNRFFVLDGGSYVLTKEIRDLCVFSPHSVIRDPPFSRLDMISCRNLLIYFGADIQNQVLPTFRYALREGGYLFLGLSESVGKFADLFEAVDKKHRVFRSRDDVSISPQLPLSIRRHPGLAGPARGRRNPLESAPGIALRQALEFQVLERFAPAHVLVNRDGDIVHFSARTNRYLELAPGAPTRQLMSLARKGLRLELRSAFREAVETDTTVTRDAVPVTSEEGRVQRVRITIEPLLERRDSAPLYVVIFADDGASLSAAEARDLPALESGAAVLLERELRDTKERLQSLIEEYETALEELRSSNEELLSVNEELQSSNEELEASKEEQQSLNEELNTVNAELLVKIDALDRVNGDLQNLFESTQIPTVFLDRGMVIRSFTPSVKELFNILPGDRGRPLTDLNSRLPLPDLVEDIRAVFAHGDAIERDASHAETGRHYTLRVAPYRTLEGAADGVVVTFIDVTRLTEAQAHQQTLIAELNHRVKNMLMVVIGVAEQTHRLAATPDAFLESFVGRLQAMARSYELLSRENWTESSLEDAVRTEVAPFGMERVTIAGPPASLKPRHALSLGMVIHELATNAGKYGALSVPAGRVSIEWSLSGEADDCVDLYWRETHGPAAPAPKRRGFGLRLIERETSYNLGGKATVGFSPTGVEAHVRFSLADM
jgi:two-component system CheB/CheR fusion protein